MDQTALRHAWERLHRAAAAYQRLCSSISIGQAETAWSEFLMAAATIYSKLDKGSKGHPTAEPWFGRIKNERKNDQLLRYIHHARNSDEHGIQEVTEGEDGSATITARGSVHITIGEDGKPLGPNGVEVIPANADSGLNVNITPPKLRLIKVFDDLHKDSCDVPTTHLGEPINDNSPTAVAALVLRYLDGIVRDGARFAVK